jgi:hypothetical protein
MAPLRTNQWFTPGATTAAILHTFPDLLVACHQVSLPPQKYAIPPQPCITTATLWSRVHRNLCWSRASPADFLPSCSSAMHATALHWEQEQSSWDSLTLLCCSSHLAINFWCAGYKIQNLKSKPCYALTLECLFSPLSDPLSLPTRPLSWTSTA